MSSFYRALPLSVVSFLIAASAIEASVALYFSSQGVSDAILLVLVSVGVIAVLALSWAEVRGEVPVSRGVGVEKRSRRKERARQRERVEEKPLISPDLRSAILVFSVFLLALAIPYVLTSTPVLTGLKSLYEGLPVQLQGTLKGAWDFMTPLYKLDLVYKYALSQNLAALCAVLAVVLLGHLRRR